MQKKITELMRCNACLHHNVCKYVASEDKITIPDDLPAEVGIICKEYRKQEISVPRI